MATLLVIRIVRVVRGVQSLHCARCLSFVLPFCSIHLRINFSTIPKLLDWRIDHLFGIGWLAYQPHDYF